MLNPDRQLPSRQLIRQQLDAGKLGEIGLVRGHRWEPLEVVSKRGQTLSVPGETKGSDPVLKPLRGSRVVADQLPPSLWRDLDLALWLVGQTPTNVFATELVAARDAKEHGRTIQVHLGFSNGAMALIGYSNQLPAGDGYQSLTVIGSAGAAYFDDHHNRQLVFRGGKAQAVQADEFDERHAVLVRECDDWLFANAASLASDPDWRPVSRVIEAVLRSLASRQAIVLTGEGQ